MNVTPESTRAVFLGAVKRKARLALFIKQSDVLIYTHNKLHTVTDRQGTGKKEKVNRFSLC